MSRNTSVSLSQHFTDFIDRQVASGEYASASEVIREGLRLLEQRREAIEALRAELRKGEESGFRPFDLDEFLAEMNDRFRDIA